MTEPKEKDRPPIKTRTPSKKNSPGTFDNLRQIPQPHPVEEILGLVPSTGGDVRPTGSTPSTPSSSPTPSTGSTPSTPSSDHAQESAKRQRPVPPAPDRDFMKVANSITRHAVPSGLFGEQGGKSKQLYDYLYSQTRGAVVPRRSVRVSKDKLMKGADIGSEVTLRSNLKRLRDAGLIKETVVPGAHGGNEYEVFLPEEVGLTPSTPSTPSSPSYPLSNLEGVEPLESRGSRGGLSLDGSTVSSSPKTSFKDVRRNTDDDEAFADFVLALEKATREITGREASSSDRARWAELAEVLVTELKIAAGRTTISSVPAFLAEHLRRRLWKKEKRQLDAEVADSPASTPSRRLDASECPDCFGAGMWYPEGYERGVARCRHEKLKSDEAE